MSDNTQPFTPGGAPAARAAVEQLKAYSAPLEGRRQMLRLDFNENTIGPSPLVAQALRNFSTEEIAVYPEYDGLRDALLQNLEETGCRPGLKPDRWACSTVWMPRSMRCFRPMAMRVRRC